jgi:hypothetical protein
MNEHATDSWPGLRLAVVVIFAVAVSSALAWAVAEGAPAWLLFGPPVVLPPAATYWLWHAAQKRL